MKSKVLWHIDLFLIKIIALSYAVIGLVFFFKKVSLKALDFEYQVFSYFELFTYFYLFDWCLVVIYMSLMTIITNYLEKKNTKLPVLISIHFLLAIILSIFIFISGSLLELANVIYIGKSDYTFYFDSRKYIDMVESNFLVYTALTAIIYIYYYINKFKTAVELESNLKEKLSLANLSFLQSQMQPHFLFNTLNSIHTLVDVDKFKSKEMIEDMSYILRHVLENKDEPVIELQEELYLLDKYININKTRFEKKLTFNSQINSGLENVLVPNMILQPIVENSIKYGFEKNVLQLEIILQVYIQNNILFLVIKNNGRKIDQDISELLKKGIGLSNIKDRLDALYGKTSSMDMYNEHGKVVTKISLPVEYAISELSEELTL